MYNRKPAMHEGGAEGEDSKTLSNLRHYFRRKGPTLKDSMNYTTEVVKKVKLFHLLQRCIFLTTESTLYYSHFKGWFFTVQPSPHLQ